MLYHTVHNFCAVDLSAIYLDILKDRLYASVPTAQARRAAQTVMNEILNTLVVIISPVLTFTSEEVWQHMPKTNGKPECVQLAQWPVEHKEYLDTTLEEKWTKILEARRKLQKCLKKHDVIK